MRWNRSELQNQQRAVVCVGEPAESSSLVGAANSISTMSSQLARGVKDQMVNLSSSFRLSMRFSFSSTSFTAFTTASRAACNHRKGCRIQNAPERARKRNDRELTALSAEILQTSVARCKFLRPGIAIPGRRKAWAGAWAMARQQGLAMLIAGQLRRITNNLSRKYGHWSILQNSGRG